MVAGGHRCLRLLLLLRPQASAEPLAEGGDDAGNDAVDALVGERLGIVAQLEAQSQAALVFGDARNRALGLVDVEKCCRANHARCARLGCTDQGVMGDGTTSDDRDVTPRRLLLRQGHERGKLALQQGFGIDLEDDRVAGQLVRLAPARVQLTDEADALTVPFDGGAAPRVQRRMRRRKEAPAGAAEKRLEIALDVEEIDGPLGDAPLQRRRGAEPEAAEPERLANAGDGDIARGGTGIANIDLPELEDAKARGLAGQV